MEDLLRQHAVDYIHVPYKGTADQMLALASGAIMGGVNSTGFAPWVDQGQLRLLALFSDRRNPRWPQVPTMAELGYREAVYNSPWGLVAPAGTPHEILDTLHGAFRHAMFMPRHVAELARYDQLPDYLGRADYAEALVRTMASERRLLHRMKLLVP